MKYRTNRSARLIGALLLAVGLLASCAKDTPTAPVVDPVAEARAAEEAARVAACTQASVDATFRAGNTRVSNWPSKDDVRVVAEPLNAASATVSVSCVPPYARDASWTLLLDSNALHCTPRGAVRSLAYDLYCEGDGIVAALVTHLSQSKVFKAETVGFVSSFGVKSRARLSEDEIRAWLARAVAQDVKESGVADGSQRAATPLELAQAARALRK